jgi:predicted PurR-regulated permease PerM
MIGDAAIDRDRAIWWLLTLALGGTLVLAAYAFVGTVVFGLFVYYVARPVDAHLRTFVADPRACALSTLLAFEIPLLASSGYVVLVGVRELGGLLGAGSAPFDRLFPSLASASAASVEHPLAAVAALDPAGVRRFVETGAAVLEPVATLLIHVVLATAIAYWLLRVDDRLAARFRDAVGEDSALWLYARLVDRDLGVVYFSNARLTVLAAVLGILVYNGYNLVAPAAVSVPAPTLLAVLTGFATLLPVVVGKVVYLPVTGYVALRALAVDPSLLWLPAALLVASVVLLDVVPVMVLRPYLAGSTTHGGLMMLAYVGGGLLFGWYGIFLGPLVLVASLHLVRVGLSDLLGGGPVTPDVSTARGLGAPLSSPAPPERADDHGEGTDD